jgi:hypothetical protein
MSGSARFLERSLTKGQFYACTKRSIGLGPPVMYAVTGVETSTLVLRRFGNGHVSCSTDYGKPYAHGRLPWLAGQRSRRRILHSSAPEIARYLHPFSWRYDSES